MSRKIDPKKWEYPFLSWGVNEARRKAKEERVIQEKGILMITNSIREYFAKMPDCRFQEGVFD